MMPNPNPNPNLSIKAATTLFDAHLGAPTKPDVKPGFKTAISTKRLCDTGMLVSLWLSQLQQKNDALYVVVCNGQEEVNRLETELHFFGVDAYVFADWETLIYDRLSVHEDIVAERIHLLSHMPKTGVLLVSIQTLLQRLVPPSWLLARHFEIALGDTVDMTKQKETLVQAGYVAVDSVCRVGEFAIRGGLIDVFVVGQALPLRLELFDDTVESIRFFSPETQRTVSDEELRTLAKEADGIVYPKSARIDQFSVLPAKEFPWEDKQTFRQNFARLFADSSHRKVDFYADVMMGVMPPGIEYYQPLFFDEAIWQTGSLFAYLPDACVFVLPNNLGDLTKSIWEQMDKRYQNRRHDKDNPVVPPNLLYLPSDKLFGHLNAFGQAILADEGRPMFDEIGIAALPNVAIDHRLKEPLTALLDFVASCPVPIVLVAETPGRREVLIELLQSKVEIRLLTSFADFMNQTPKPSQVGLIVASIERGFVLTHHQTTGQGVAIVSESHIFGRQVIQSRRRKQTTLAGEVLVKSVVELTEGSLVVHLEHGIGRYLGLVILDLDGGEQQEFIHLKYADDASIYVPITHLGLIGRYSSVDSEAVSLSKIGSGKWDRARQKTLEQIYDVAAELLNAQARRRAKQGISFSVDMSAYGLFASGFAFEETADQQAAIAAVIADMKQSKPMDRLICGDVGFGKTEVAMRAAFIAVSAGYQVVVVVPTTLLAGQHEDSFKNRFADWPIRVESLSRFGSKTKQDKILASLAQGGVDIVIGTHKLLQDDVKFAKLGLIIIDEEHRFGVRHKEKIRAMQSDVDSLSMTATPIPRTLNMALSGMQDISIIATPPARRLAIKTFVVEKNDQTIIDAVLREILRGGQVYYLHNEVASIDVAAESLSELIPEARVGVAHGQMSERDLSAVMSDFYHKKYNVLMASTIIETGINVPNANTIIIDRSDKFGLAQLHQLRGRVGRSHHQAYCYLFVPSIKGLSTDAAKRLEAVSRANTLGAGFMLASEDLEIRGAGEILGKEQSGHMQTIGFGLYTDMLNRAIKAIKAGKEPKLDTPLDLISEINLHTSALIPNDYLGDVHERLLFYKRIAATEALSELADVRVEMVDRFGAMPMPLVRLFLVHKLRILAKPLGIIKIDANAQGISLEFRPDTPVDAMAVIALIQSDNHYRMNGATGLKYAFKSSKEVAERFDAVFDLLAYFKANTNIP